MDGFGLAKRDVLLLIVVVDVTVCNVWNLLDAEAFRGGAEKSDIVQEKS